MRARARIALVLMALSASFGLAGCAAIDELKEAFLRWVESEKLPSGPGYTGGVWEVVGKQIPPKKPPKVEASKPSRAYRALSSRRTYIPKADGGQRPLGIAALEDKIDKIVQAAQVKSGRKLRRTQTVVVLPRKKPPIPDSTEAARPEGTEGHSAPSPPEPPQLPSRWPKAPPPGRFSR
jgi:hypothetical protein